MSVPHPIDRAQSAAKTAAEVMETIPAVMQFIRAEMRNQRSSLSVPQFRVLNFLRRHPGTPLSAVADHLGITRASASVLIDRLVQQGLIDRSENPQQRRQIMLQLTQTGSDRLEAMRDRTRERLATLLETLTPEECEAIELGLDLLQQVVQNAPPEA